jgi:glycosyltransferase involved in cell wall biosynthesis
MAARARLLGGAEVRIVGTPVGHEFIDKPVTPIAPEVGKVLFLGRLAQEKNLQAFVQAAEAMPDLEFHIVGDGPQRDMVISDAERLPNLKYRGWKTRNEVVDILDEVQMLVLPSHEEAFGTVVVEAMARGRLVLTSSHCGVVKWPRLGECVFTIDEGETLEAAVRKVCALPEIHRERTASLGCELAQELNDATIDTWVELLGEVASRKQA